MTEPFSVTGTAVGIISLGLQTCQMLYKYCSEFKSFPRDVEAIQRQTRGLHGILEGLREVKEQLEIDSHTPSSQLYMALKDCEEVLYELKRMVEKRNPASQSDGVHIQLQALKERFLWPYRKEDLKEVQLSLARFQANLALALQCAGLDGALRRLRELHSELIAQQQQAIRVEENLNQSTELLQIIRRDIASQDPTLSKIYNEIMSLRTQLLEVSVPVRVGQFSLTDSKSSSQKGTCTLSPTIFTPIHKENNSRPSGLPIQERSIQTGNSYSCHCRSKRKRKAESRRWYMILTDEAYDHDKDCPRFTHGDFTKSVAFQLFTYNSLLKFCVQIGWQCLRKGGWNSPAPMLRYRAVAPQDSPVFRLLDSVFEEVEYPVPWEQICSNMATIFPTIASKLQQEFRKGACPTDLDESGEGIIFAIIRLIDKAVRVVESRENFMSDVSEIIDVCFDAGVPFDDKDADGRNPVEYWLKRPPSYSPYRHRWMTGYGHVLSCLVRKVESWSFIPYALYPIRGSSYQITFDYISVLLRIEPFSDRFNGDDPRHEVILRRSELDFCTRLKSRDPDAWIHLFANDDYVHALVSWPEGLSMTLSSAYVNVSQDLLQRLLNAAIVSWNIQSIGMLFDYGAPITQQNWNSMVQEFFLAGSHNEEDSLILAQMYRHVANHLYRDQDAGSDDQTSTRNFEHVDITDKTSSLYHSITLTSLPAECAWQAGHRKVESIGLISRSRFRRGPEIGTPLWAQVVSWTFYHDSRSIFLPAFMWLIRHGADPFWVHPIHLTTPAHMLVRQHFVCTTLKPEYREYISMLFSSKLRDNCHCHCSQDGCSIVGCTIGIHHGRHSYELPITHLRKHQAYVFSLVNNNRNDSWIASAILRICTFNKLSLTHTCCHRVWCELRGLSMRTTPEEAKEIHDLERDDIEVLEKVVAELEEEWAGYRKPFATFMNRVWSPRMRKIRLDREVDKATHQAELVRMGIRLVEPDGEIDSGIDSDGESDASWPDDNEDPDSEGWYTTDEDVAEVENHGEGSS